LTEKKLVEEREGMTFEEKGSGLEISF